MTKVKVVASLDDHCGQCRFFAEQDKVWMCVVNPPIFNYVDYDQTPNLVVYARGGCPILSSAPACEKFIPRRLN